MKTALFLSFAAGATAFAPASVVRPTSVVVKASLSDLVGVSSEPPHGGKPFGKRIYLECSVNEFDMGHDLDPLGFAEKNPSMVPFYREAELKHGRMVSDPTFSS